MRVLVCGDREWKNRELIRRQLESIHLGVGIEAVIEGECVGADTIAREEAEKLGIKVIPFTPKWRLYGIAAGPIRNKQMIDEGKPELVLAFHNDLSKSKGTKNMIEQAKKAGVKVQVIKESV